MIANSLIGDYDTNDSYNWAQWKEFNQDMALGLYIRTPDIAPMKEKEYYQNVLGKQDSFYIIGKSFARRT